MNAGQAGRYLLSVNSRILSALFAEYARGMESKLCPSALATYRRNRDAILALWAHEFLAKLAR